ncbi:hypothetical protein [Dialister invisus]|uniref:hypothetical protein n=1 Tax=Dialister invisus TaxID=218538 RepID=UPI0039A15E63
MDWPEETPVVRLKIDQDKVRKLGGDNYSISRDLYVKLSGYKVAESYQGNQLVPISFRLEGSNAARLADLSSLLSMWGVDGMCLLGKSRIFPMRMKQARSGGAICTRPSLSAAKPAGIRLPIP